MSNPAVSEVRPKKMGEIPLKITDGQAMMKTPLFPIKLVRHGESPAWCVFKPDGLPWICHSCFLAGATVEGCMHTRHVEAEFVYLGPGTYPSDFVTFAKILDTIFEIWDTLILDDHLLLVKLHWFMFQRGMHTTSTPYEIPIEPELEFFFIQVMGMEDVVNPSDPNEKVRSLTFLEMMLLSRKCSHFTYMANNQSNHLKKIVYRNAFAEYSARQAKWKVFHENYMEELRKGSESKMEADETVEPSRKRVH